MEEARGGGGGVDKRRQNSHQMALFLRDFSSSSFLSSFQGRRQRGEEGRNQKRGEGRRKRRSRRGRRRVKGRDGGGKRGGGGVDKRRQNSHQMALFLRDFSSSSFLSSFQPRQRQRGE